MHRTDEVTDDVVVRGPGSLRAGLVEVTVVAHNSAKLDAWLQEYVTRASRHDYVDYFVRRINEGILAHVPPVRADPLLVEDLDYSTRSHWLGFLEMLIQPEPKLIFPEPAAEFARSDLNFAMRRTCCATTTSARWARWLNGV
jgi:hypothetical protein